MKNKNKKFASDFKRVLLVSNRLPVKIEKYNNEYKTTHSTGGLATGLASYHKNKKTLWTGWAGLPSDSVASSLQKKIRKDLLENYNCRALFLSERQVKFFYSGFCNKTLWPLFHYFTEYAIYDEGFWSSYVQVNKLFCDAVLEHCSKDDLIWVHDYHLMLLPQMLRKKRPDSRIGFFLHIPFPSYEVFRLLPWKEDILQGLLGADLVGFHTYDYMAHFISSVRRILDYDHQFGKIRAGNHNVQVDAFPMGIDYEKYADAKINEQWLEKRGPRVNVNKNNKLILSVDRLDYTKGILERLTAFDRFLEKYPEFRGKVSMICIAAPSRTSVEKYQELKKKIDELVGYINGRYSTISWIPICYLYHSLPFEQLNSLYNISDIALITPIRDGMNLIAKEYMATTKNHTGVLILSEMAGACSELAEALIVNPNKPDMVADAIKTALEMPEEEQKLRNEAMRVRLEQYNVHQWVQDFIHRLQKVSSKEQKSPVKEMNVTRQNSVLSALNSAASKILFMDLEGILGTFRSQSKPLKPDVEIIDMLYNLSTIPGLDIVLISDYDYETVDEWIGNFPLHIMAEHGLWVKEKNGEWHLMDKIDDNWKGQIRHLIKLYVSRTPHSFIEENTYSLTFNFQKCEEDVRQLRVPELKESLIELSANYNLQVEETKDYLEVKLAGANKGRSAQYWTCEKDWDFIMAVGDNYSDEDLFESLGDDAVTIKVGSESSTAKYYISDYKELRRFLKKIIQESSKNTRRVSNYS